MIIEHDTSGWASDTSISWKLVYKDKQIIFFEYTELSVSTQENLFVGTKEECEQFIADNNLNMIVDILLEQEISQDAIDILLEQESVPLE